MNRKPVLILLATLFFLGLTVFLFFWFSPWQLTVYSPKNGQVLYSLPLKNGEVFSLHYTHSVTNREVSGTFAVTREGKIKPLTTTFDAFGPGLPYLDGSLAYVEEGGSYTVLHEEEDRENISLFVSPLTRERLTVRSHELELSEFQENPLLLHIYAQRKWR